MAGNAQASESQKVDLAIGAALRDLREGAGLTARQLAAQAGVSAAMISRIENGLASPSIHTLGALSAALEVPLVSLFRETASDHSGFTHVRSGRGLKSTRVVDRAAHDVVNLAVHARRDLQFEARMVTLAAENAGPASDVGHGALFIYVIEGEATYRCGQREIVLKAGDSLSLDAELSHGFKRIATPHVTFLTVQAARRR